MFLDAHLTESIFRHALGQGDNERLFRILYHIYIYFSIDS